MQNWCEKLWDLAKMKIFKKKITEESTLENISSDSWKWSCSTQSSTEIDRCDFIFINIHPGYSYRNIHEGPLQKKYIYFFLVNKSCCCFAIPTKTVNFLQYCVFRNIWKSLFSSQNGFCFLSCLWILGSNSRLLLIYFNHFQNYCTREKKLHLFVEFLIKKKNVRWCNSLLYFQKKV